MARRRGRFRRVKPDMGWFVSPFRGSYVWDGTAGTRTNMIELMAFAEIDGDGGIIAKDKSDWFIKRILLDGMFMLNPATFNGVNDAMKMVPWMLGTWGAADAIDMATNGHSVAEPDGFDSARRVIRTGYTPTYLPHGVLVEGAIGADFNAQRVKDTSLSSTSYRAAAPYFGVQRIEMDITVSNAGLVPDSSLYLATTTDAAIGAGAYGWETGDGYNYYLGLRVLLQKRAG